MTGNRPYAECRIMPGAVGRLFSGGGTGLPALQWGSLLAPGVDFMAGVLPLEAWLGKNGGRRRGGSCCGSVGVVTAGGDFLGVRGVVVGVFVAPDPSGKGAYQDLSLEMIRKTRRIGRLTPSAGHQWLHGGSRNRYPAGRSTFRFARDSSN